MQLYFKLLQLISLTATPGFFQDHADWCEASGRSSSPGHKHHLVLEIFGIYLLAAEAK